jgi:nucleotide-binding universal stress UspA family protein
MDAPPAGRDEAPVVICYDGTPEAVEALEFVAELLPGMPAIVVSVWKPVIEEALAAAGRQVPPISDIAQGSEREQHTAVGVARDGARRASDAGLDAEAVAVETVKSVWEAVEQVALDARARLIACGTAKSGMKATVPTALPNALVHHSTNPVLVVPSSKAAAARRREFEKA